MDATSWNRVKDLIADALELPPSERIPFLEARCTEPALLEEALDLLKWYDEAQNFLEKPGELRPANSDSGDDVLEPGTRVGPYVIVGQLGGGGMGRVYLGNDQRLRRKVALKRLFASPFDPSDEYARILQEARAAALVNHPNVATIHDVVEQRPRAFIVMEYVEGETLADWLRREPMPLDRTLAIGRQLASALVAAHASGVVHRDLKPANIQLTREGIPKILDFGIAKSMVPLSTPPTVTPLPSPVQGLMTRRGAGTPQYMSPEQLRGLESGPATDIFSLGIVLFEMATRRRPFEAMSVDARKLAPDTPAPRADSWSPDLSRDVADVIAKALAIEPQERYQSAQELESALEDLLPSRPGAGWKRLALRAGITIAAAPLVLGLLGLISTAAFNITLQRPARFASEPLRAYMTWGLRSNLVFIAVSVILLTLLPATGFLWRMVGLIEPIARVQRRIHRGRDGFVSALGLNDPIVLAQGLAAVGIVAVAAAYWRFWDLIMAVTKFVSIDPPGVFAPLAPASVHDRFLYRLYVDIMLLVTTFVMFRILQLRARQRTTRGRIAIATALMILALVLLMHQVPYRILYQSEFERTDVGGERCYLLGVDGGDGLVHCADAPSPRNRVIQLGDPSVRRLGIIESIFTPPRDRAGTAASSRTP